MAGSDPCPLRASPCQALWFLIQQEDPADQSFWAVYDVVLVLSLSNLLLPPVMKRLVFLDNFTHPKRRLQVTIIRVYLLRMMNLYGFIYGLYKKTEIDQEQLPVFDSSSVVDQVC